MPRMLEVAQPAAAADLVITPTGGQSMEICAFDFNFDTDANAADRIITLQLTTDSVDAIVGRAPAILAANEVAEFTVIAGASNFLDSGGTQGIIAIPARLIIQTGDTLTVNIQNIQAGDQISGTVVSYLTYFLGG